MPDRIEPCLARLVAKPPMAAQWAFEIKWDGYRLAIHKEPGRLRILTRGGHDWTERFPAVAEAAQMMAPATMILDGEGVILDEQGRPDFSALQDALGGRGGKRRAHDVIFIAFDLLYLDGRDLRDWPLFERRNALELLIVEAGSAIRFSNEIETDGASFLKSACDMGLEGIIAKRRNSPYRSGRKGDWIKVKCVQREGFLIIGYEPSRVGHGGIGRLLLAARKGDELVYVGGVGTGFTDQTGALLREALDLLARDTPAASAGRRRAIWVKPLVCAEIEFRGWTKDGKLRHSSFKGLRDPEIGDAVFSVD